MEISIALQTITRPTGRRVIRLDTSNTFSSNSNNSRILTILSTFTSSKRVFKHMARNNMEMTTIYHFGVVYDLHVQSFLPEFL